MTVHENEPAGVNTVALTGRITGAPLLRELPSGDPLLTFRLSVPREPPDPARRQVDWFDCAVWTARLQRSVSTWQVGDQVTVTGTLRRRHFRTAQGPGTRVEVAVLSARRRRRTAAG